MLQNAKMANMAVECAAVKNDNNTILIKAERMYDKQRQLHIRLLEINNAMVGTDVDNIPELEADCVIGYLDESENILNCSLDLANNLLHALR